MSQPGTVSRNVLAALWLLLGALMLVLPAWVLWTRWSAVLNGHPALLVLAIGCLLGGAVALAWAVATLLLGARYDRETSPGEPGHRTAAQLVRRARWRIGLAVPAMVVCALAVGVLAWARPFAATEVAVAAMRSSATVKVSDRLTWYELTSVRQNAVGAAIKPTTGFVFSPGARVDARAYAALLQPVAKAGYLVVVLKEPLGIALTSPDQAESAMAVHPEIKHWAVGGHSLGGVAAAGFAESHSQVKGLVLYASYPASAMTRTDLKVLSVSGTNDGLATPADIEKTKAKLPPGTTFVVVAGGVHAYFGDYGDQPGDGQPSVARPEAQAQIIRSTEDLLASLAPPAPVRKK